MFQKATQQGKELFGKVSDGVSQATDFVSDVGDKVSNVGSKIEKNLAVVDKYNQKYVQPALQGAALAGIPGASQLLGASEGLSNLTGRVKDVNNTVQQTNSRVQNVNNKVAKGNQVANRVARKI